MTSIANKLDTVNTPANAVAGPDSLLTMPKTTSVEQDTRESHALAFTIFTLLALLIFTGIVGAVIFLVKKIRQAVGVQWHPELGEFEKPKKGFKKTVREFPEDVKEFFTPAEPYRCYPDDMEPQDPQWARTYLTNIRGLDGLSTNVLIPQVWMVPKCTGTLPNMLEKSSKPFVPTAKSRLYTHASMDITELLHNTSTTQYSNGEVGVKDIEDTGKGTESPVLSIAVGEIFPNTPPPAYFSPPPFYYKATAVGEEDQVIESDLAEMRFGDLSLPIVWKPYVPDRDHTTGSGNNAD